VREFRLRGSVRGAAGNGRPYREPIADIAGGCLRAVALGCEGGHRSAYAVAGSPPRCGWPPIYVDALIDQFLPGEYDPPAFALELAHKDVSLANALGFELGIPMRLWRHEHTSPARPRSAASFAPRVLGRGPNRRNAQQPILPIRATRRIR
jgi:hypothetical protein